MYNDLCKIHNTGQKGSIMASYKTYEEYVKKDPGARRSRQSVHRSIQMGTFLIIVCCFAVVISARIQHRNSFVYSDHQEETAINIDDYGVTFKQFGYYVIETERRINQEALAYDYDNPSKYWKLYLKSGEQSAYISTLAREEAYMECVVDFLYADEAIANNYGLTDEDRKAARKEADDFISLMTERARTVTGLTDEDIYNMALRKQLATSYANYLLKNTDWSDNVLSPSSRMNYNGDYFQDTILAAHKVSKGSHFGSIKFGTVTVN